MSRRISKNKYKGIKENKKNKVKGQKGSKRREEKRRRRRRKWERERMIQVSGRGMRRGKTGE